VASNSTGTALSALAAAVVGLCFTIVVKISRGSGRVPRRGRCPRRRHRRVDVCGQIRLPFFIVLRVVGSVRIVHHHRHTCGCGGSRGRAGGVGELTLVQRVFAVARSAVAARVAKRRQVPRILPAADTRHTGIKGECGARQRTAYR
jgi:hypothetical protein